MLKIITILSEILTYKGLFFVCTFSCCIGIILWQKYKLNKHNKDLHVFKRNYKKIHNILNNSSDVWVLWDINKKSLIHNENLANILNIHTIRSLTLNSFLDLFSIKTASELKHNLFKMEQTGKNFSIKATFNKKTLSITGQHIKKNLNLLWLKDISQEQNEYEKLFNTLEKVRKKYDFLNSIINDISIPIWYQDKEGKLLYCNKSYSSKLNLTPDLAIAQNKKLFITEKEKKYSSTISQSNKEYLIINNVRYCYELHEKINEKGKISYINDVTKSEKIKTNLLQQIKMYHEVFEALDTGIAIYDSNKHLTYFNQTFSKTFELDKKLLKNKPTFSEILEDRRFRRKLPELTNFIEYKNKQNRKFNILMTPTIELEHLPDGRTIKNITTAHHLGGLFSIFKNVTNKLNLERKLNLLIDVKKEIIHNLLEGVAIFGSDNRLKFSNLAFRKMWNLSREKVKADTHLTNLLEEIKSFFDFKDNWETFKNKIINFVTNRIQKNKILIRNDGTILNFSYIPLPDGTNLMVYIDITKNDNIPDNKSITQVTPKLLTNISHELLVPLNSALSSSEILLNQYFGTLNHQQTNYIAKIHNSSQQLLNFINDILDLTKIETKQIKLNLVSIDTYNLLYNIIESLKQQFQLKIKLNCNKQIGSFIGDKNLIEQAFLILLKNSIRFGDTNDTITIDAIQKQNKMVLSISSTNSKNINYKSQFNNFKELTKSFNPKHYSGIDLNLSLAKGLIKLHKGLIKVTSNSKSTITISCYLPINVEKKENFSTKAS